MMENQILAPISWGELLDKITILEIKGRRIGDLAKLRNIQHELAVLQEFRDRHPLPAAVLSMVDELRAVNEALWDIEDDIRDQERSKDFGPRFVELARSVYRTNDERARLKRDINVILDSNLVEEKSYKPYG